MWLVPQPRATGFCWGAGGFLECLRAEKDWGWGGWGEGSRVPYAEGEAGPGLGGWDGRLHPCVGS